MRKFAIFSALPLIVILGFLDRVTGYEFSFSIFYVLPILLVAWYVGRFPALGTAFVCSVVWLIADLSAGHNYSHFLIPAWNSVMRLGFFILIVYFSTGFHRQLKYEKVLSRMDPLTSIPNARYFLEQAEVERKRALRFKRPLTIVYIDIDNFKQVNDSLGHGRGDELLHSVAQAIAKNIRSYDLVARMGGDEFVILFPETDGPQAALAVQKVHRHLLHAAQNISPLATFSLGVVTYHIPPAEVEEMVKKADDQMYSVKRNGKNAIKFWPEH